MFTFNFRKLLFVIIILLNNLVFANVNLNLSCQSEIISLFGHELRMVACADKVAKYVM